MWTAYYYGKWIYKTVGNFFLKILVYIVVGCFTFGLFSIRIVGKADGTGTRTLLQYADNLNNHFSNTFFGATHKIERGAPS